VRQCLPRNICPPKPVITGWTRLANVSSGSFEGILTTAWRLRVRLGHVSWKWDLGNFRRPLSLFCWRVVCRATLPGKTPPEPLQSSSYNERLANSEFLAELMRAFSLWLPTTSDYDHKLPVRWGPAGRPAGGGGRRGRPAGAVGGGARRRSDSKEFAQEHSTNRLLASRCKEGVSLIDCIKTETWHYWIELQESIKRLRSPNQELHRLSIVAEAPTNSKVFTEVSQSIQ